MNLLSFLRTRKRPYAEPSSCLADMQKTARVLKTSLP